MTNLLRWVCTCLALALASAAPAAERDAMQHFFHPSFGDLRDELAQARAEGKQGLFVMFAAEACAPCIVLKRTILAQVEVQEHFRRHFRVLHVDYNGDEPMNDLQGREMRAKDYARDVARIHRTPTFVAFGLDGRELLRHQGTARDAREFMGLANYVVGGAYREQPFEVYWRAWTAAGPAGAKPQPRS
mgnify:CR=1 FL=1